MPGYTKIGKTTNLEQRMRGLDTTGIPIPFECCYAAEVNDADFVEKQLHEAFADNRVRKNREFFEIPPERVAAALKIAEIKDVTPGANFETSRTNGGQGQNRTADTGIFSPLTLSEEIERVELVKSTSIVST